MISQKHTLIHHFLEQSAQTCPDKVAIIQDDVRASYTKINSEANQIAHWLISQGIKTGDRVVLILENNPEYVVSYYGVLKAGAVAVSLNNDIKPEGLKHVLREIKPRIIISSSKFKRLLHTVSLPAFDVQAVVLSRRNFNWFSTFPPVFQLEEELRDKRPSNLNISVAQSALSSIVYTSGSTGKPRGIMLSHRNIVSNTHSIIQALHLTEKDIQMVVLPFSYVMGKSLLNTHFAVGGTVIINNKFAFSGSMIKQMSEEGVTGFSGVPSTYAYLLHRSPLASYQDRLGSLRYCSQAGGHMSRHVKEKLRRVLPKHTHIYIMYGTTEASARLTCLDPSQFINNLDSVGKPIPDVKMFVMDKAGHGVAPGEIGEIVATGPNIMMGYWNDEEATKSVMDQAGYHTGDLGYRDSEGYYFIVGRKDNQVKIGGHRINTQEIEKVLIELEQVTEAAVLGIPDELLGQKLIAVIAPKNTACDEKMILNLCAMKLPRYQIPAHIKLVRTLPKTSSGKVDKAKCLDLAKL